MGDWDGEQGQVFFANGDLDIGRADALDSDHLKPHEATQRFREFIRNFHDGSTNFVYRDLLKSRYHSNRFHLNVDLKCVASHPEVGAPMHRCRRCTPPPELALVVSVRHAALSPRVRAHQYPLSPPPHPVRSDVNQWDGVLFQALKDRPETFLPCFEEAARQALALVAAPDADTIPPIHIILEGLANCDTPIRKIKAALVNRLVCVPGIVIGASKTRAKATDIAMKCRQCGHLMTLACGGAFGRVQTPRRCGREKAAGEAECPLVRVVYVCVVCCVGGGGCLRLCTIRSSPLLASPSPLPLLASHRLSSPLSPHPYAGPVRRRPR